LSGLCHGNADDRHDDCQRSEDQVLFHLATSLRVKLEDIGVTPPEKGAETIPTVSQRRRYMTAVRLGRCQRMALFGFEI
jgi:hypothetical protein